MIALVTAFPMELASLTNGWQRKHIPSSCVVYFGKISLASVCVLVTGIGFERTKNALSGLLKSHSVKYIFATGYAGGLSPELSHGALVLANKVVLNCSKDNKYSFLPDELLFQNLKKSEITIYDGSIVSSSQIIDTTKSRQHLSSLGAAVDMESLAVAEIAEEHKIPWCAVRAITDTWNETFPIDFLLYQKYNGQISYAKVIFSAIKQPHKIKQLLKFGKYAKIATKNLTAYWQNVIPKLSDLYKSL